MPKWYHRIDKSFREELTHFDKSYQGIEKGCDLMIKTVEKLKKKTPDKARFDKEHEIMQEILDHFDFCKDFATGKIKQDEWDDYSFDGDLVGLFNSYMNEFWNLCDTIINNKDRFDYDAEKFCWVEV